MNSTFENPVDRKNHIVHGVKVLGFTSANGRIYDFDAVKEAIAKYEKAPVNKDHNMEEPSFSDRLGWLENVTLQKDGLYADFHYNPHADGIESFLWFAEHNGLGDVGFSHLVSGKYSVDPDGTERITRIDKVKSVDLVANPATTKTIFESEVKPMNKKVVKEAMNKAEIKPRNESGKTRYDLWLNKKFVTTYNSLSDAKFNKDKAERYGFDYFDSTPYGESDDKPMKESDNDFKIVEKMTGTKDDQVSKREKHYDLYYKGKFIGWVDDLAKAWKIEKEYANKKESESVKKITNESEKEPIKQGDSKMDKKKLMEEENPMQNGSTSDPYQEEAEQDPMMEEADDVYAKIKEICEGEGSDEEKSKQVLEMLGLSGGMSEGEGEPMEEAKEDPKEKAGSESDVLEVDDEEDEKEEPKKESKSELASLRKWKAEKLKEEKIVNLIKESNLEPTKVFIKQLSAIDSKLWSEAINDRKKVALVKSSVKPISSGLQSRSESSYKQFLESVLGK